MWKSASGQITQHAFTPVRQGLCQPLITTCLHFTNTINALNIIWPSLLANTTQSPHRTIEDIVCRWKEAVSVIWDLCIASHILLPFVSYVRPFSMTFLLPKHPVFSCICDTVRLLRTEMFMNEEPAVTSVKPVLSGSRDWEKTFVNIRLHSSYLDLITVHKFGVGTICLCFWKKPLLLLGCKKYIKNSNNCIIKIKKLFGLIMNCNLFLWW